MEESKAQRAEEGEGVSMGLVEPQTLKSILLIRLLAVPSAWLFRGSLPGSLTFGPKMERDGVLVIDFHFLHGITIHHCLQHARETRFGCFSPLLSWCTAWLAEIFY
jgi:hypothetical protein